MAAGQGGDRQKDPSTSHGVTSEISNLTALIFILFLLCVQMCKKQAAGRRAGLGLLFCRLFRVIRRRKVQLL